ncbi:MAG: metallophosphoesterase [Pseudomonadota bacterium]
MRIAIMTDIHHGPRSHTKRGDTARDLLQQSARFVVAEKPDLVLDLGDRISDVDHETDLRLEREVADALSVIGVPIYHVCGNHDRDHLSVAENAEILGQSLESQLVDLGDWTLALWGAEAKIHRGADRRGFDLPESDLLWLAHTAAAAEKPLLVASHVPISGHSQIGNYYFENTPEASRYPQSERARAGLAKAPVPVLAIAGHVHWNTVTIVDGIPHLTQQSLTESFTTQGAPAEAWGLLELGQTCHWQVFGGDPCELRVTPQARRWTVPHPPFQLRSET